jgi:hypothetical protein
VARRRKFNKVTFDIVPNRGKESAENLKVKCARVKAQVSSRRVFVVMKEAAN